MINHGVIKENGKVMGYNTPSELYAEQKRKEVAARSNNKLMLKKADYALESWARWLLENDGYGDSSLISLGSPKEAYGSRIPGRVEMSETVASALRAFDKMEKGSDIDRKHMMALKMVHLEIRGKETVKEVLQRLNIHMCDRQFRRARERFSTYLDD